MTEARRIYSVLLVSASEKVNDALKGFLPRERFGPVAAAGTVARARRMLAERDYDLVIINSPLPDDFGRKLAADVCAGSEGVALLLVRSDLYDQVRPGMTSQGVLVARRPLERSALEQILEAMCSIRERLRRIRKKTVSLEERMEEIRLVNRAKWALISAMQMTEEEAHRYIQKQAMDLCVSKKEAAEMILRTYS